MFKLYKITGKFTPFVYYGYCGTDQDSLESFLQEAHAHGKPEQDRGSLKLIRDNNNDRDSLQADDLAENLSELDAFKARNDERARDPLSITGPSHFPAAMYARVQKEEPEKVRAWKHLEKASNAKTARGAYTAGAFTYKQVKKLGEKHGNAAVMRDLDKLTPHEFSKKYEIKFEE